MNARLHFDHPQPLLLPNPEILVILKSNGTNNQQPMTLTQHPAF
jgi:hypothetical protein